MLELQGVAKRFGSHPVLTDLSFSMQRGEILGLLGSNGSGKTTTVRLINGVIAPDAGRISVFGLDPAQDGEAIRRRSGILTESAGMYLHMTGLQNLEFFADLYGVTEKGRAQELLREFGLEEAQHKKVGTYSTGMKKRLGLAKALLHRPEILFLDEPTNGLDPEGIRMVMGHIAALNQRDGTTIILCSHLLQQLETVCHRYVFVDKGRVIEAGTQAELEARYTREILLRVETDVAVTGERYRGLPVQSLSAGQLQFTLPGREAVPQLLRDLLSEGAVYGATVVNQDLESLYFMIREAARS